MRSSNSLFSGIDPVVTLISKVLIIGFVVVCAVMAEQAGALFSSISTDILHHFKWFYLAMASVVLVFSMSWDPSVR